MTCYRNGHGEYDECRIMCMGVVGFKNVGINVVKRDVESGYGIT